MKLIMFILLLHISLSANWKTERERLHHVYMLDEFRIFYDTQGKHEIFNLQDNNANKIPDYIENIALRFKYTRLIFTKALGFHNPLQSQRYKDVDYIDIHILNDNSNTTGDGIHHFNYRYFNNKNYKSIAIKLKPNLRDATMTPSYGHFQDEEWMHYNLKNYPSLLEDNRVYGYLFMRYFFETLDEIDDKAEKARNLKSYNWPEKEQKSSANNSYILQALIKTIKHQHKNYNMETAQFLRVSTTYIKD